MMNLIDRDKQVVWHPYTQMKTAALPIAVVKGEGIYLETQDGRRILDAISSWWVTIHGHSNSYIAQKVSEQLSVLEQVIFAGFTHPKAVELAERLLNILPSNQSKIFYTDNGSTATEVALKMTLQYWYNKDCFSKNKIIAFKDAYHGDTFGAMSVSGRSIFTKPFEKLLFDVEYIDVPNDDNIDLIKQHISNNAKNISAFIFEPLILGAGGMLMYKEEHLDELIRHCRSENILLIADEVMTGFGRTGKMFASDYLNEQADIICLSKGLTGGTMPLGVTSCSEEIYNMFLSNDKLKTLFHGHSFTASPLACAASLASLDLFDKALFDKISFIDSKHKEFKEKIQNHYKLKEVRHRGTIIAFEWNNNEDTSYLNNLRDKLYNFFLGRDILIRPLGNILYLLPPYCITEQELDFLYKNIEDALEQI